MPKDVRPTDLRRLVLDVLKPHNPSLPEFATKLGSLPGVESVNVTLVELDKATETIKVTIDGRLDYGKVYSAIENWGGVVHSVDEVSAGRTPVGEIPPAEQRPRPRPHEGRA